MNRVIILGNVGQEVDIKMTSATTIANFSVATKERYKDKSGEPQENTEWHRVVAFGKLADIIGQYVSKGSKILIEGKLKTDKYDKNGVTHYTTKVIAEKIEFCDKARHDEREKPVSQPKDSKFVTVCDSSEEDIPF